MVKKDMHIKLQKELNGWLDKNKASSIDSEQYTTFLKEIGYLLPEGNDFQIETSNIDDELSLIPHLRAHET